uniref:Uncharacterized protein n=1 Tax=Kalanchoe fedtschenkoi TaxID=63787 RepID=A0A7N0V7Z8_KALFE
MRDCIWFLPTESPTKANDLFLMSSRNKPASNRGSSHSSGFHLHLKKSESALPNFMQFNWS